MEFNILRPLRSRSLQSCVAFPEDTAGIYSFDFEVMAV